MKPLKWTLSSVLGDSKIPEEEEVLIYVELLQVSVVGSLLEIVHLQRHHDSVCALGRKDQHGTDLPLYSLGG